MNRSENTKIEINKGSEDLITEMFYYSEDNKGNKYEIKSEYGIINPDKSNLILMDKVSAVIFMLNGEKFLSVLTKLSMTIITMIQLLVAQ